LLGGGAGTAVRILVDREGDCACGSHDSLLLRSLRRFLRVGVLVVAETADVRLAMEEQAEAGDLVGILFHRLGDGLVPHPPDLAPPFAELWYDFVFGEFPELG